MMEKRRMEKLNAELSLLGFGCMRFPLNADGKIDEPEAEKMLDRAIAAGVNYIDTAYPYHDGASEPFVGRALKKYDRKSFYLATKLPAWLVNTADDVDKYFQEQLDRLQTDYIDFYLIHNMNKDGWHKFESLGGVEKMVKLQEQGKIRYLGFSFHDQYEVFEEILNYRDWDFCQIQFNYMDTEEQAGLKGYELAESKGIPMVIMEPIKGGTLARLPEDVTSKFRALDANATSASYALRWVGSFPNVKVILSGMSTMEQVEDNLKTFETFKPLTVEERTVIDDVVKTLRSRVQNGCTGCRYCMPCPFGVDIPGSFSAWNNYHMYRNYDLVSWNWEIGVGEAKQPKNCAKCGACEKKCPQHLHIREDLERAQADMDKKEMRG